MSVKDILLSNQWPEAVNPLLICNISDESDKLERAEGILEFFINDDLQSKKFLDFGCGEGHLTKIASQKRTKISWGYDITESWAAGNLTTNWDQIKQDAPFDIICLYDVVDHIEIETVDDIMKKLREVSNVDTKIYIRCHPWCGRHAGHLYDQINKAFVHVVFTEEELKDMGYTTTKITKIIHPITTYEGWFEPHFKIAKRDILTTPVEPFFKNNDLIKNRIVSHWKGSGDPVARQWPDFQLRQSFLDYILNL